MQIEGDERWIPLENRIRFLKEAEIRPGICYMRRKRARGLSRTKPVPLRRRNHSIEKLFHPFLHGGDDENRDREAEWLLIPVPGGPFMGSS